ncbi:MAG: hypothetical protein SP1CHLAM54_15880 [Chlamydiia bacterium]|nr:hypothetical protein [Chlamydiia bacterium]MCH9616477.1 hypothetical protein [Chlamydiia bacterium]MCH9629537.1 hypothetical protein [Chlamydiia bacterium]
MAAANPVSGNNTYFYGFKAGSLSKEHVKQAQNEGLSVPLQDGERGIDETVTLLFKNGKYAEVEPLYGDHINFTAVLIYDVEVKGSDLKGIRFSQYMFPLPNQSNHIN